MYILFLFLFFLQSLLGFGSMSDYLLFSAEKGHIQNVKKALLTGGDINSKDYFGKTALIYAVTRGDMELIQLLFKYGAASSIHFKDRDGNTALDYAKLNKNERVIAVLKDYGAKD